MPKSEAGKLVGYGAAATAIGGAYKFGEFLYKAKRLRDVGPANAVYVRLIHRVRQDLDEVKRLLTVPEVKEALKENPPKAKWVYGVMRDVRGALENITPHTERVGSDIEAGKRVGIRHRFYWLLSEKEKLENREKELNTAHGSLMEVIGFLTTLEPVDGQHAHEKAHHEPHGDSHGTRDTHKTRIDVDIRRRGPERAERVEERDVWIERRDGGPQRVIEERETIIERDRRGPRHHDEREYRIERRHDPRHHSKHELQLVRRHEPRHDEHHRGPRHVQHREDHYQEERDVRRVERDYEVDERGRPVRYDERETWVDRGRDPKYEAQYDERELHIERDPRDPGHVEASYVERGPHHYEEKHYQQHRFGQAPLGRRPESFEDRVPERDTFMQSEVGGPTYSRSSSGRSSFGDPGFGDEEVVNPQLTPFQREVWVEEKVDLSRDKYGNKVPRTRGHI